jgi:type II secretory pathway predicted ATPase ExeA
MSKETENTETDCRSKNGKVVSLVDTISILCGLLMGKSLKSKAAMAAIQDLRHDESANYILRKLAISDEEVVLQKQVHAIVQQYRKDSPQAKYEQWLKDQIDRSLKLSKKAGQPKGSRQQYAAMAKAYEDALKKLPPTSIAI